MTRPAFLVVRAEVQADPIAAVRSFARSADMPLVASCDGYAAYTSHPTSLFRHRGGGVSLIIGDLLEGEAGTSAAGGENPLTAVADPIIAALELSRSCWGGYVAVIKAPEGFHLFADPSGVMPFDLVEGDGITVATDDVSPALFAAIGDRASPDWPALARTLVEPLTAIHLSHLKNTRAALPGGLHTISVNAEPIAIWSPAAIARRSVEGDPAALRAAVDRAARPIDGATSAMLLSGGLDSSIVLSTFCGAAARPLSITFATVAAGGDERSFASIAAEACRSRLVACGSSRLPSYRFLFDTAHGARPPVFGIDDVFESGVSAAARAEDRSLLITGQGGDAVFFQPKTPLVGVDRVRAFGLRSRALAPLMDDARRAGTSVWNQLLPVLADRIRRASVPADPTAPHLLTPDARDMVRSVGRPHPWVAAAADLSPGKRMQIEMIANSQIFHSRRPRRDAIRLAHPLLSQPVLEATLPIPTYELCTGPLDRGLAREAFRDRLPQTILGRRIKGDATDHYSRGVVADLPFLRDVLLDGVLVREGLVDRDALDRVLTREHLLYSLDYLAISMHATCEAWARYWTAG